MSWSAAWTARVPQMAVSLAGQSCMLANPSKLRKIAPKINKLAAREFRVSWRGLGHSADAAQPTCAGLPSSSQPRACQPALLTLPNPGAQHHPPLRWPHIICLHTYQMITKLRSAAQVGRQTGDHAPAANGGVHGGGNLADPPALA